MGFDGNNIDTTEKVVAEDYNEIKDNIDTTADELGIDYYNGTSDSNISVENIITSSSINELRDATDYLDNENYCQTHNSNYNNNHDDGQDGNYDGTDNSNHDDGQDGNYDGTNYTTHHNGNDVNYDSGYNSGHYTSHYDSHEEHFHAD